MQARDAVLHNLNDSDHLGHSVSHGGESYFADLLLFKLLEAIADVRLNLGACIDTNHIIGDDFPLGSLLNNLIVFIHISLLNNYQNYISQFS